MQLSNPVLICDENDEFRVLMRDILTKNGFFHILEASNKTEALNYLHKQNDLFVLMDANFYSLEIISQVQKQKDYLIIVDDHDKNTPHLILRLNLDRIISHPISSRKLMNKILKSNH